MQYFDFFNRSGTHFGGQWDNNTSVPRDYAATWFQSTTPAQDLVILNYLYLSQDDPPFYFLCGASCGNRVSEVFKNALGPQGLNFNPINPYTGNIFDPQGNWIGWQDPYTGNLYDSEGDWAGWNRDWDKSSSGGGGRSIGSYGTANGYGGGNFIGAGLNGFGGLGSGFGGVAGGFIYGIGGQGYGGVGGNSPGVDVEELF
jgi:hypothetical protein